MPEALRRHPDFVPVAGVLDDFDAFDHGFFGLTPREAELHDPQLRVMLETVWHAFEDAGCDPAAAAGPVGVFAGMGTSGYYWNNVLPALRESQAESLLGRAANDKDFLATLISYKLDLRGPSMSVQTACSTSLVAVHLAVQSLLAGECDLALAGGATIVLPQDSAASTPAAASPRATAAAGPSTPPPTARSAGSGAGVVVLRRLEDALAAGDAIYAVIRGSAVNNDGARKVGFTAPSVDGQVAAIERGAGGGRDRPGHGRLRRDARTATAIGDAIELRALRRAFAGAGARNDRAGRAQGRDRPPRRRGRRRRADPGRARGGARRDSGQPVLRAPQPAARARDQPLRHPHRARALAGRRARAGPR